MHAPLAAGSSLGPYRILDTVGAGGMGEVYRALDPKLDRVVAIKVLHPHLSQDPRAMARFRREAKAVASLSHPNILDIHDLGEENGRIYAVMELLEGHTFRALMREGPIPLRRVRTLGIQVALGLAAAHGRGLVHRDIKPENLFLTHDGRVKILDFGLAKPLLEPEPPGDPGDTGAALPASVTQEGVILGTVGYMSPEQVRGQLADARSDLFSLGVVLVEMVTGHHPFRRDSTAETLSSILKDDPFDAGTSEAPLPPALERFFRRCLEKAPEDRFQHAKDLAYGLEALPDRSTSSFLPLAGRRRIQTWLLRSVGVLLLLAAGAGLARLVAPPAAPGQPSFQRLTFRQGNLLSARFRAGEVCYSAAWEGRPAELYAVRPDGTEDRPLHQPGDILAASSRGELALRLTPHPITAPQPYGTLALAQPGASPGRPLLDNVLAAAFSPDGQQLAATQWVSEDPRGKPTWVLRYPLDRILLKSPHALTAVRVSPRGDELAVFAYDADTERGTILRVDLQGQARPWVKDIPTRAPGMAWMPKGDELWYSVPPEQVPHFQLWATDRAGRQRLIRTDSTFYALHDIGPDGRCLVERSTGRMRLMWSSAAGEQDLSLWDSPSLGGLSLDGQAVLFTEAGEGAQHREMAFYRPAPDQPAVRLGEGKGLALSPDRRWALLVRQQQPGRPLLVPLGTGLPRELDPGLRTVENARFVPQSDLLVVSGSTKDGRSRTLLMDLGSGAAVRELPTNGITAADGRSLLAARDGQLVEMSLEGTILRTFAAKLKPGSRMLSWSADRREVHVWDALQLPQRVHAMDLASGRERLLRTLPLRPVPGFLGIHRVLVTRDGQIVAYCLQETVMSDLLVVTFPQP